MREEKRGREGVEEKTKTGEREQKGRGIRRTRESVEGMKKHEERKKRRRVRVKGAMKRGGKIDLRGREGPRNNSVPNGEMVEERGRWIRRARERVEGREKLERKKEEEQKKG